MPFFAVCGNLSRQRFKRTLVASACAEESEREEGEKLMSALPPVMPSNAQVTVLIFMKSLSTPIVLYADNPTQLYEELKQIIRAANPQSPKLLEKQGVGPLKKVAFLDTELSGVAIQMDPITR
jgi:hypothetical protein